MVEALGRDSQVATPMAGSWRPSVKEVVAAAKQCQGAPGPDGWQPDELSQLPEHAFALVLALWEWTGRSSLRYGSIPR